MCGIAGLISDSPRDAMSRMLVSIEHRGRDDEGVFVSAPHWQGLSSCLGHRRLSIIDTSAAGHQPFQSCDGRFSIVFNGEIYNYRDLRARLEGIGHSFKTDSDTEVLLNAFREWGTSSLEQLNGMFAFAVWDDVEKTLVLARDRAGIKPLYYWTESGRIAFGSEIKAILASGLLAPELDHESLNQYLTFLWPVPPRTLFQGVSQIPPGHFLIWKNGECTIRQWWDLDYSREEHGTHEKVWTDRVFDALDKCVSMEMVADVPLGAFLSGGVDSSSIVALMTKHNEKVATYTTGMSAEDLSFDIIPDDVEWSRRVAELLPVEYHETLLTPDLASLLPKLVRHMDAPVIDMAIPSFLISEQARSTHKVMLSGMGGDEVFAGYPRQLAMKLAGVTDIIPSAVRRPLMRTVESMLYGGLPGRFTAPMRNLKKFAKSAAMDFEERYLGFGTYFTDGMKTALYADGLRTEMGSYDAYRYHHEHFEACRTASPLNRLLYVDFKTFMPALNLDTTDKTSMAANLEVRVPFLNHELVSLSERIPADLKIKGLKRKYVLKKAAERLLPKEIIWRKKAGFSAPIRSWIRTSLRPMIDDLLSEDTVMRRGLFDPAEVRRIIDVNHSGKEDLNLQVFQLLALEIWMREMLDRK